jgi:cellulose synthase/poly-beta-1,6-N-acetylglucosamine synthase-like glycosyltransferase
VDVEDLVTVVIPALNEEHFLGDCLDSVTAQDYGLLQIVVVDGGSNDRTVQVVEQRMSDDPRIELVRNHRPSIPTSLNLALEQARGRWLVRVDAHSTVGPDYVRRAVEHLREDSWGGVGGRKDGVGRTSAGRAIAVAMGSRFGVGNSTYHHGTSVQEVDHLPFGAYPVDVVRSMNGWDEDLVANEDFEFDYRLRQAGMRLLFDPAMVIRWHCRQSIGDLFRQYQRYGRGKVDVVQRHPESMSVRHFAPPAMVAYLAFAALLNARRPGRLLAMVAPYLVAVSAASVPTGRKLDSWEDRAHVPLAFMAMHIGWGLGFWSGVRSSLTKMLRA